MQRAYGVLRIIAGQHHNAAAAAALQAGGVSSKFIADAEGILCGKNGVLERVVHAAQADAGERSLHGKEGEELPVVVCQHQRTARGQKAQLAALIGQQNADTVFGKVQPGSQIGQGMLKPGTAKAPSSVTSS